MPPRRRQHAPLEKAPENKPVRLRVNRNPASAGGSYSTIGLPRKLARMVNLQKRVGNAALQRVLAEEGPTGMARIENLLAGRGAVPTDQADHQPGENEIYETQLDNSFSGAHWETKYPAKDSLSELNSSFGNRLNSFLAALRKAGASVTVKSTLWPSERVYLMHWAYRIARQGFNPQQIPAFDKVDIRWWHGTPELSRKAAEQMLKAFKIDKFEKAPSLKTHHADGQGLDMEVAWGGVLMIEDAQGQKQAIKSSPHDGTNSELVAVAASFGVIMSGKHTPDGPLHWSIDGN